MNDRFAVEIIVCENGYIVLEGNSLLANSLYGMERKKWIAETAKDLGTLIERLATQSKNNEPKQGSEK